jgi:threonine dehydratase
MKTQGLVSLDEILEARSRLRDVAVQTPLDRSRALSEVAASDVFIKCESLQRTGSFKIRGAYNRICRLSEEEKQSGVVAASAGNHAQGVALAASLVGTPSTLFMPVSASLPKVEATRRYGAEVVLTGKDFGAAYTAATEFTEEQGAVFVHPFDHPHVIAGQGTIGCEIDEQIQAVGTVIVPVGGGGLISGVAAALHSLRPEARIFGVQAAGAAAFPPSLEKGEPVRLDTMSTIADGIAANMPGDLTLAHVAELVDEVVTVGDDTIARALLLAAERMKLVLEPAGAAGVAAVLAGAVELVPPTVVVLSGGNVDPLLLQNVIRFGLGAEGRYFAFHTRIEDRPGSLSALLQIIAGAGANIVGVEHHRVGVAVHLGEVDVMLQLETRGRSHIDEMTTKLSDRGYVVEPI